VGLVAFTTLWQIRQAGRRFVAEPAAA
jgi:hypothetical protein